MISDALALITWLLIAAVIRHEHHQQTKENRS